LAVTGPRDVTIGGKQPPAVMQCRQQALIQKRTRHGYDRCRHRRLPRPFAGRRRGEDLATRRVRDEQDFGRLIGSARHVTGGVFTMTLHFLRALTALVRPYWVS